MSMFLNVAKFWSYWLPPVTYTQIGKIRHVRSDATATIPEIHNTTSLSPLLFCSI